MTFRVRMRVACRHSLGDCSARGDVGLAEASENLGVKAGAVVADRKIDGLFIPTRFDRNICLGEVDGVLDQIAKAMTAVTPSKVTVTGHTDSTGASRYNQSLSEARAKAVVDYLAGKGVEAARMTAAGKGKDEPVADNATAKGRAANRRVELLLSVQ